MTHAPWKVVDVSSKEVPQRWADRMVERGFTDPRYTADIPSLSRLAEACGVHTTTISSAIKGTGRRPSAATVVALSKALGDDVAEWLGEPRVQAWDPPAESSLLTDRQRKAVEEIIRAMTERREDVGNDERSAPITETGNDPARNVQPQPTRDELADMRRRQDEADKVSVEYILDQAADREDRD